MKFLFLIALSVVSFCAEAQTILSVHEPMSPFCKVMAPLMGLLVIGVIGYGVVKLIGKEDNTA